MRKILLAITCALAVSGVCKAQDMDEPKGKPTVYIDYFKRTSDVPYSLTEALRNSVMGELQQMQRVILIDVDSQDALRVELNRRNSESVSTGDDNEMDRLAVMSQLGAQYIITGHVASMSSNWVNGKDGKEGYYDAAVSYTMKVINANNGTLVGSHTIKQTNTDKDRQKAITGACTGVSSLEIAGFVDEYFKIQGTIIEVNKEKKGKAEEVYINVGTDHGVIENQKFTVYVVREVAGRTARKEVGRLNVKSVEGEDIALCKVNKGGDEILKAFNEERPMVIISRKQTIAGEIGNIFR